MNPSILLTIDVEDWFQVENFKKYIPFSTWPNYELRVEKNTHLLLNLLDSLKLQPSAMSYKVAIENAPEDKKTKKSSESSKSCLTTPKATFFVLGWIAERLPHLVKEIHSRGHEVASHGYRHNLCTDCSSEDLKTDLVESKKRLEDTIGAQVFGYRAASFSINDGILKIIEQCGYLYDSSFNSFGMHGRYGKAHLSQDTKNGIATKISNYFYELPLSNLRLGNHNLPWAGGGYFRVIPFPLFKLGVHSILKKQEAYLFYMHPWEIDPEQPKVNQASAFFRFRHYTNLDKTASKLSSFIEAFKECTFITCYQYLQEAHSL